VSRRLLLFAGVVLAVAGAAVALVVVPVHRDTKPQKPALVPTKTPRAERVEDLAARVPTGRQIALRSRPDGPVLVRLGDSTEFGSPQTFAVVVKLGNWVAVRTPALGNRRIGWVDADRAGLRFLDRPVSIEVDLSKRTLTLREHAVVYRRLGVAIGSPETPTPPGTFYVTDKLRGADFGPYYGCCILALSGRQPNLPKGWSGGDRLAIHGTPTADFGHAVTNGCVHASEESLRYLMKRVPLGTPVLVHA
jgi:lipoprotein-anchoring transpeptidase ErfK/SrfK